MRFLKTTLIALAVAPALFSQLSAQTESFKVLAKKGTVTINSGGKSRDWNNLGTGYSIYSTDKIKVDGSSYLSLVYPTNGRAIEIKKAGTYSVKDLVKQATAKTSGVAGKYATYVAGELSKVKEPVSAGDKHQSNMGSTGSVERAQGTQVTQKEVAVTATKSAFGLFNIPVEDYANKVKTVVETLKFDVAVPKSSYIIDPSVMFVWHPAPNERPDKYVVTLADEAGRVLFEMDAKDTFLLVNISKYRLDEGKCYTWRVNAPVFPPASTGDQCIMKLPDAALKNVQDTARMITMNFGPDDTPLKALTLGHMYEANSLFLNAMQYFKKASELEPEIDEYRLAYARFLERVGLDNEAMAVRNKQ